ncbi:MAG: sigma-70 family RNA polymerase sigma factor [Candidatus Coproplasma sp.]
MIDEELVAAFQSGDRAAGEELMLKYKSAVLKVARRFFLSGGETEDLVQEGMCGLYSAMLNFKSADRDFSAYAYACIKNRIVDAIKANSNCKNAALNNSLPIDGEDRLYSVHGSPEDELINSESESELSATLKRNLSPLEYKVMSMYVDGVSMSAISENLGKSYKTIDNAIMRSKRKLQKIYKGE